MTETAPRTERPETIDGLDATAPEIRTDIGIIYNTDALVKVPGALAAIDALITALANNGDRVEVNVGVITMTRDGDDTGLRKHLATQQARYDRGRELYQSYLDTGAFPKYRSTWLFYLECEGIVEPTAPADDEVDD
ncbi:hypothetical protein SEA_VERITY_47 [Gordonia phage Verity]|uniref:Uncharacterized protein n=2 Tax=Zitchvirus TaxID=2948963 RepID=A0A514DIT8_9CAUD|nr:hypothetical protein J1775_gp48 [Gordonia phage Zipp]YP_010002885.1 hypothetical protein J1776_gp47 [Gordonia phage Verity]QPO16890.1 hypothetical protein SEA_DELREY21_47 [Gordonia phage Delrey21]QXN74173.1 hypothetical protein SEA_DOCTORFROGGO_47 [Gordonia phage DoctorFroggo]QDH93202.1 hypothetical protein SEA_ZIPP_48 [Gordonia phage Zipp]QDH93533.1 hypothetical protein SEA_VERITY_47 [Gordonia phage Verity]